MVSLVAISGIAASNASYSIKPVVVSDISTLPLDSPDVDLIYPIIDPYGTNQQNTGLIDLNNPSNIQYEVVYDPVTGQYVVQNSVGGSFDYRPPMSMSLEDYLNYDMEQSMQTYWSEAVQEDAAAGSDRGIVPEIKINSEAFDRIFGGNTIDIRPQGSAELIFGLNISKTENPRIPVQQRKITTFDFDQRIQLNVIGNIGDKLKLNTAYNTEATFDFENQVKLDYTGHEDEIIQKIEAGNVTLPLNGQLIQGSQSLFGLKTELKFGRLTATAIFSQEKGQRRDVAVSGGAQTNNFEIKADEYEANKYYFLSYYFRDNYESAMRTVPTISSGVDITRIEVWVTNTRNDFDDNRNIVAFTDLGEDIANVTPQLVASGEITDQSSNPLADNGQNSLYASVQNDAAIRGFINSTAQLQGRGFQAARDYEKLESARMLTQNEYTINERLGFIGLNQSLNNDEVLAVAYQYTFQGQTYQVGEFSTDGTQPPDALILRLLKSTITDPNNQLWDLMMKNVYSLGAYQVNREDFRLDLVYNNPATGVDINYIPRAPIDNSILLQVVGMDRLDMNLGQFPDGIFDYVDNAATMGGTINSQNGRIFFPVLEPFGTTLNDAMIGPDPNNPIQPEAVRKAIVFQALYDSTRTAAQNQPELNRFKLRGSYRSASSDVISLNSVNIPQGSVVVTAGGVRLQENQDYTVDYNLGRVKILNQGILESGTPINISLESQTLFSIQTRTLSGARLDFKASEDLNIGATVMNLFERPLTPKVNVGDEPISNTIWGVDASWRDESQFLTDLVDKLPFYDTKEMSSIDASAEFAHLIPGHSSAIGNDGTSYIDDFEGSVSVIDLRTQSLWNLAATPQGVPDIWPEGELINDLEYGYNRAKLAWYVIDPLFFRDNSLTPPNIDNTMKSDNRMREVLEQEVFPNRVLPNGTPSNIPVLDLAYYPAERGPYNYNPALDANGDLPNPDDSWAGITRQINTTDFEASNIEVIQFWVMDPFQSGILNSVGEPATNEDSQNFTGGDLYIHLGNVSEDVLRDSRKAFENGLPKDLDDASQVTTETDWGVVPTTQSVVNAFSINDPPSFLYQDVGLDGVGTAPDINGITEVSYFSDYINSLNPGAQARWASDPSADDYHFFRGTDYDNDGLDILQRYKQFNGLEGNSVTDENSPENYPTSASTLPSTEDINQDQNLAESEAYFQYKISMRPEDMVVGQNFINDRILATANTPDGPKQVYWYQFKVPVRQPDRVVNGIQDFRSIRFMRMALKEWQQEAVLRFARLEFVRGEWRKYLFSLESPGESPGGDPNATIYETAAVNIEENGNRTPINYVTPPGIEQEIDVASTNQRTLNEQSLQMFTCNLRDGDARASFRNVDFDIRSYKKLKMYVHAESADLNDPIEYGDVSVFMRLGNDFDQNYYEYEIPAVPSVFGDNSREGVWPEDNNMEIEFAQLNDIKIARNNSGFPINQRYIEMVGDRRITVKGNPNLSQMNTIMVGIRNPQQQGAEANPWKVDDGLPQCVEVWVNELRLTDFDQRGGWAAIANVNAKLADLGTVSVAGNYSTPFFGSIDKRVSERSRETKYGIDAAANLEMGKFLPESSGVRIPMYLGFSENISLPQFDPLNPDIEWDDATRTLTAEERKERLRRVRTYQRRRSINFTNVGKSRTGGDTDEKFYDIENLSFSYGYSDINFHDVYTEFRNQRTHRASIAYIHSPKPRPIKPFENIGFIKDSKWLKLVKDFNINAGFKQLSIRTDVDRSYTEQLVRPNSDIQTLPPSPTVNKNFLWNSAWSFQYDITKALKVDFSANNGAIIGEPPGRVDKGLRSEYNIWRDSVLTSIQRFGETTNYDHLVNVTYKLPLDKFPLTDWMTVNTTYGAGYRWDRAPLQQDSIGNTVQNSQNISVNGQLNFVSLYNKSKYLKKINDKARGRNRRPGRGRGVNANKNNKKEEDKDKDKDKDKDGAKIDPLEGLARILMAIRTGNVTYSQNSGLLLPGYGRKTNVLGMSPNFTAPGIGFILGQQNHDLSGDIVRDFATEAAGNGWLVQNPNIFNPYTNTRTETFNGRVSIEPFQSMRIELLGNRTISENRSSFFRWSDSTQTYVNDSPQEFGNFSVSTITWATAFSTDDDNFVNDVFLQMLENRLIISERLGIDNPQSVGVIDSTGFYDGFGETSQDVVIPAFLAAYRGQNAAKSTLNPFSLLPLPNWDITYDGLTKLEFFRKYFRSFKVNHSYRSTFSIANYQTNLFFDPNGFERDVSDNFIPERQISAVNISEVMRPFVNFDMTLNNSMLLKFEYNRDRSLSLSLTNYQITEVRGKEFVIGTGYRFKDVPFPFKVGDKKPKSDMNLRIDLSLRDNFTVIRKMQEGQNQVTAGQNILSIKTSADYVLNNRLNLRAFYDRVINSPVISTSFPSSNTNAGISLRFTLSQ